MSASQPHNTHRRPWFSIWLILSLCLTMLPDHIPTAGAVAGPISLAACEGSAPPSAPVAPTGSVAQMDTPESQPTTLQGSGARYAASSAPTSYVLNFNGVAGTQFPIGCYKVTMTGVATNPEYYPEVFYITAFNGRRLYPFSLSVTETAVGTLQAVILPDGTTMSGAIASAPLDGKLTVTVTAVGSIPVPPGNLNGWGCSLTFPKEHVDPDGCATPPPAATGDPIDLRDGSLYLDIPCFALGGAGLPIKVGLHYSSRAAVEGRGSSAIGPGWFVGQHRRITMLPSTTTGCVATGTATCVMEPPVWQLTREDGTTDSFHATDSTETTFTSPAGSNLTLTRDATSGQYTLTYRSGQRDIFAASGARIRTEDRLGNALGYAFNAATGVQTITNLRTQQAVRLEHALVNGIWKLTRIADAPGNGSPARQVLLGYDAAGMLTSVTDVAGRRRTVAYDGQGRITTIYDANSDPVTRGAAAQATITTYDALTPFRVSRQVLANGTTIDLSYTGAGVAVTYQAGQPSAWTVTYTWGERNTLTRVSLPNRPNEGMTYRYDGVGRMTEQIDPLGRRTVWTYDVAGDVVRECRYTTATSCDATEFTTDRFGARTSLREPAGAVTRWGYDALTGATTTITREDGLTRQVTQLRTNSAGQVTTVILPDGTRMTQSYDSRGYPDVMTSDANSDGLTGRLALTEDADYDWRGYLTAHTNQAGIRTVYEYAQNPALGQYGASGDPSAIIVDQTPAGTGARVRTTFTYDAMGNVLTVVDDAGAGRANATTQYQYAMVGTDGAYATTAVTNTLGVATRLEYSPLGEVLRLREVGVNAAATERVTTFSYTPEGWPATTTLHDGRTVETVRYNSAGQPLAVVDAVGVETTYTYDDKARVIAVRAGTPVNVALGKAASQSSTYAGATADLAVNGATAGSWGYISSTNAQAEAWWQVDLGNNQSITTINLWNRTDCCAERLSNVYVFVSDTPFASTTVAGTQAQAGVSSYLVSSPTGDSTPVAINRSGRYVRVQLAGTNYLSLAEVEVLSGTVPNTTRYTYDANDRVIKAVADRQTGTVHTVLQRQYDGYNRLVWERDGVGNQTTYQYDARRNWITRVIAGDNVDSEQHVTDYQYDALGRRTAQVVDPGAGRKNLTTLFRYTTAGSSDRWHLQEMVDPNTVARTPTNPPATMTYRYTSLGQLASTRDALGQTWQYAYTNLGDLRTITPPSGAATTYAYDLRGQVTSLTRNGQTETWAYNRDGTLKTAVDFMGQATQYTYDSTGRLTALDRAGTSADAQFAYTATDQLAAATSKPDGTTSETTTYTYDALNRLRTATRTGRTLTYGYDATSNLTSLNYWGRGTTTVGYDAAARPTSVNPWGVGASTYTYRATDLLATVQRPNTASVTNNILTRYGYDTASRLTGISHTRAGTDVTTIQYPSLDANGNRLTMLDPTGTTTYQYDSLNRLTEVQYPSVATAPGTRQTLGYDAVGNRTLVGGQEAPKLVRNGDAEQGSLTGRTGARGRRRPARAATARRPSRSAAPVAERARRSRPAPTRPTRWLAGAG